MPKAIRWALVEFPGYIVKLATAWGIIWGFVYFVAQPHVKPWVELPSQVEGANRRIATLERAIRTLSPQNTVAEYDALRSNMEDGKCRLGKWCTGEFRVRRLPAGVGCAAPDTQAFVTNHGGVTRPVIDIELVSIRVGRDWVNVPFRFKVPKSSQPGVGEFYYENIYSCQTGAKTEQSAVIVFDIVE